MPMIEGRNRKFCQNVPPLRVHPLENSTDGLSINKSQTVLGHNWWAESISYTSKPDIDILVPLLSNTTQGLNIPGSSLLLNGTVTTDGVGAIINGYNHSADASDIYEQ